MIGAQEAPVCPACFSFSLGVASPGLSMLSSYCHLCSKALAGVETQITSFDSFPLVLLRLFRTLSTKGKQKREFITKYTPLKNNPLFLD